MARHSRLSLNDDKDKEAAITELKMGQSTEFWRLIVQALDESIEHLQAVSDSDDLKEYSPDRYKLESELLKAKKKYLKRLKDYPKVLINRLQDPDIENYNFDPYERSDED